MLKLSQALASSSCENSTDLSLGPLGKCRLLRGPVFEELQKFVEPESFKENYNAPVDFALAFLEFHL